MASPYLAIFVLFVLSYAVPSPQYGYGIDCECSDITLLDANSGKTIGNCLTRFRRKFWCYVSSTSQCTDKRKSSRTRGLFYSYKACTGTFTGETQPRRKPVPIQPPLGQRCSGRNYNGRRCCTPENPCNEGEGDCDGPGDGGLNDGDEGCKGDLMCGSNNCKQFGLYYHDKDDCCQKPATVSSVVDPKSEGLKFKRYTVPKRTLPPL